MQLGRKLFFVVLLLSLECRFLEAQTVNIVQTAINRNFTTLVAAVTALNLSSTLMSPGPLTVFAPTDAAFGQLPAGVLADLLKPENRALLNKIVLYHVVNGNLTAASISSGNVMTVQNGSLAVNKTGATVQVNGATVVAADVFATNGVIHAIDRVLLPPFDVVGTALTNGNFRTLAVALQAANLVGALQGAGPFTVFAPTDAAFQKIDSATLNDLLLPANINKLANILKYHVVAQRVNAASLPATLTTLSGSTLTITRNGSSVKVNNAMVTSADVGTTNGLIHVIDTVLMPPTSNSGVSMLFSSSIFFLTVSTIFIRLF